jgi:hypothetical protein
MFRCSFCSKLTQKGEPMTRVPLETRAKTYPFRERANRYSMKARDWPDDPGGKGFELVKEGQACPGCAAAAAQAGGEVPLKGMPEIRDGKVRFIEVEGLPGATYINPDL